MLPQPCVAVEKSEEEKKKKKTPRQKGRKARQGQKIATSLETDRQLRWMDSVCAQVELGPVQGRFTQF